LKVTIDNNMTETPIQKLHNPLLEKHKVTLWVKRDDLCHPLISGNKWRKLKYNFIYAKEKNISELISFSGPFSNHLYALAGASRLLGFNTKVLVRGPELDPNNPCLKFANACGIDLIPVPRLEYRQRNDSSYLKKLSFDNPSALIIPEGGSNKLAMRGVIELGNSLPSVDQVWCATGSGGTLAGLVEGLPKKRLIKGVAVLKQADYLNTIIKQLSPKASHQNNWQLITDYHGGGYGKFSQELWQFCRDFRPQLPLEPIYTGKLLYAIFDQIAQGKIKPGTTLMMIHSGGLQGLIGLRYRGLI
jgi:1-aminocyclopropane-1-carboxylate deaminase